MPEASILIRTWNEEEWIGRVLDAALAQTVTPEVIVLDSGSTDGTVAAVRARPAVRLLTMPQSEFTYGRALNRGFEHATAPVLCALSGHSLPIDDRWLERLLAPFKDPTVAAAYGRHIPHAGLDPFRSAEVLNYWGDTPSEDRPGACRYSNTNGGIRAELWRRHPFDEEIPYAEDHAWGEWALSEGHRILYVPDATVYHSHQESIAARYRRLRAQAIAEKTRETPRAAVRRFVNLTRKDLRRIAKHPRQWRWAPYSPLVRGAEVLADRAAPRER